MGQEWKPSTFESTWEPKSFEPTSVSNTAKLAEPEPEDTSLWGRVKKVGSDIINSGPAQRMMFGEAPGDADKRRTGILSHLSSGDQKRALASETPESKVGHLIGPPANDSLLPKHLGSGEPESFIGGAADSLYRDYIRPLASPSSALGMLSPGKMNSAAAHESVLGAVDRGMPIDPKPVPMPENYGRPQGPITAGENANKFGLPAAPPEIANQGTTNYYAGHDGVVPNNGSPMVGPLARGSAVLEDVRPEIGQATSVDTNALAEQRRINGLKNGSAGWGNTVSVGKPQSPYPAQSGEITGGFSPQSNANLPYPENIVPNAVRPRTVQTNTLRTAGDVARDIPSLPERPSLPDVEPLNPPKSAKELIESAQTPTIEQPSAKNPLRNKGQSKANTLDTAGGKTGEANPPTLPNETGKPKASAYNSPSRPIPAETDAKSAVKQWADGRRGATYRGKLAAEKFSNLTDPKLVDAFESGDRSGELKDLENYFNQRHEEGVKAGIFGEDQKVENYIRHEFDNTDEEIQAAMKNYVPKTASISKTRGFPTYADAEASGLKRKFTTIPELVDSYETKFHQALRNKEFYDYLKETKQLKPGQLLTDHPSTWTFTGKAAPELQKLTSNVLGKSPEGLKAVADTASVTKNIYLSGGIPFTKYNMHQWNIARNDMALNGYASGLKKLFTDATGNKAVEWMKNLPAEQKEILADLADRGWQGHPMADTGHEVNLFEKGAAAVDNKAGKAVLNAGGKVLNAGQKVFEDPLFKKSLPALTAQRTLEAFHGLVAKGLDKESALKAAAQIGNDFYGGVDTVLRNPVNKDLSRIAFLAPNWMESQLTKAVTQWKGAAKTVAGKGTAVDKIYAKSLGRSAVLPASGAVVGGLAGKALLTTKGRDIAAMPLGTDEKGKDRELPTLTTANEEIRLPITAPIQMYMGNPAALKDLLIKNRLSAPAKTVMNLVRGQDDMGNPLAGKDKYGRPISTAKGVLNYANEASKPFQHQALQSLIAYLQGKMSREEAIAQGLELPVAYSKRDNALPMPR